MLALMSSTEGIIFGSGQFQRHDRGGFVLAERNGPSKGCSPSLPGGVPMHSPLPMGTPGVSVYYTVFPRGRLPIFRMKISA